MVALPSMFNNSKIMFRAEQYQTLKYAYGVLPELLVVVSGLIETCLDR